MNAYRVFLGRDPETAAVIEDNLRRSPEAIIAVLARSGEFGMRLREIVLGRMGPHASLSPEALVEARAWARAHGLLGEDVAGDPVATLIAGLVAAPVVAEALQDAPEDVRAAAAGIAAANPEHLGLHLLDRPATEADARAIALLLAGPGATAEDPAGRTMHALVSGALGQPSLRESMLRDLAAGRPLPVYGLAAAEVAECAAWLEARMETGPVAPPLPGALLATLLGVPAVEELLRRHWPADHPAIMGALPALASGAAQLAALRVTAEDVRHAYLALLGRPVETAMAVQAHEGSPLAQLVTALIGSPEFRSNVLVRLAAGGGAPPHHGLGTAQRRQVARWLEARLGAPSDPAMAAVPAPASLLARTLRLPALAAELARLHGALWAEARQVLESRASASDDTLLGGIDYVTGDWIAGWARDSRSDTPLEIEILRNGRVVALGRADRPRPGLDEEDEAAGMACGFRLPWSGRDGAGQAGTGQQFQIVAARSGTPIGPPFQLDSVFVEPRTTLQVLTQELQQARATLDRLERMLPQLESFTSFPPEEHASFRRAHRILPPPTLPDRTLPDCHVVVPCRGVSIRGLRRILAALQRQAGARWTAHLLTTRDDQAALAEGVAVRDPRITHAMAATDDAAAELAAARAAPAGSLVLLLPPGAMPGTEHCLAWFAHAAARHPASPAFLCDEDVVVEEIGDRRDRHATPRFREVPDEWSLPGGAICGEILCAWAGLLAEALEPATGLPNRGGRCRVAWAALARRGPIAHIPRLLVARQTGEGPASEDRQEPATLATLLRRPRLLPGAAMEDRRERIAAIIPTRNGGAYLAECLAALRETAAVADGLEVILLDNGSDETETLDLLAGEAARGTLVLRVPEPFNWARLNNQAAARTTAEHLLFLNDDTRMLTAGWDRRLRHLLAEPGVGAVGARLVYDDLSIQHAGVVFGMERLAGHEGVGAAMEAPGPGGRWQRLRAVGAVTGAFLACPREVFVALGGFDEEAFGVTFNDVDFCLRLRESGQVVLYAPEIALVHHESKSRGLDDLDAAKRERAEFERRRLVERWGEAVLQDPGFNPHWSRWTRPFTAISEPSEAEILAHLDLSARPDPWRVRR